MPGNALTLRPVAPMSVVSLMVSPDATKTSLGASLATGVKRLSKRMSAPRGHMTPTSTLVQTREALVIERTLCRSSSRSTLKETAMMIATTTTRGAILATTAATVEIILNPSPPARPSRATIVATSRVPMDAEARHHPCTRNQRVIRHCDRCKCVCLCHPFHSTTKSRRETPFSPLDSACRLPRLRCTLHRKSSASRLLQSPFLNSRSHRDNSRMRRCTKCPSCSPSCSSS